MLQKPPLDGWFYLCLNCKLFTKIDTMILAEGASY